MEVYLVYKRHETMSNKDYPITQAVRFLRQKKIPFIAKPYPYVDHGGTRQASLTLDVPEQMVIKTLLMESDDKRAFIVLMHGDCEVSTKQLARQLGVKRVSPCDEKSAEKHTGYKVGGISPFGTRAMLRVYAEKSIMDLERICINGGKRGLMIEISTSDLSKALTITPVEVAIRP
jgi:Cys-tRNA(Pro) deacylase